jgi:hypothetical protein
VNTVRGTPRRIVLVGGLLAAAIAGLAVAFAVRSTGSSQGPLVTNLVGQVGVGLLLRLGESGSFSGPFMIRNTGDQPVVLDKVELLEMQKGFDFRGAYVVPHANALGDRPGYKVPANGHALPGAIVAPHQQVELVLGATAAKQGRYLFKTLDIAYHDSSGSFRRHAAYGIAICAPPGKFANCPAAVGPR